MAGQMHTGKVILGEDPGTTDISGVRAAIYYPYNERDHRVLGPNPLSISLGPFPVLLYAHAFRAVPSPPIDRDFTMVEAILRHIASYGFVCVAPDLSHIIESPNMFEQRGLVLLNCYAALYSLNPTLFASQLDLARLALVGHSRGGGGVTHGGRMILEFAAPKLAYGLIAPEMGGDSGRDLHPLLVIGGGLDIDQGARPDLAYAKGGNPKTLVMIPGANHYGYTDICPPNGCNNIGLFDENGTITRDAQQKAAAYYLAAFVRHFVLGDPTTRPYLSGDQIVPGLENYVTGIQVQSSGFGVSVPPILET